MKKSVKRIVSFVSAIAMLSTTAMAVSAAETKTSVADANSAVVSTATDFSKIDADVFVITSATSKMEKAALEILKEQFKAEKATKNAIMNAAAEMDEDELKAAIKSTTDVMNANEELSKAVEEAVADIKTTVEAAKKANKDADIVVSNVYNPFAGMASSALVDAAKAAAEVYVNQINTKIEALAAVENLTVAKIAAPEVKVDTKNIATSMAAAFDAQAAAKNEAIAEIEVEAEAAPVVKQYGDFNNDGDVKAVDLVIMLQGNLGILKKEDFDKKGYDWNAADVDRDGEKFGLGDVMMIKKVLLEDLDKSDLGKF